LNNFLNKLAKCSGILSSHQYIVNKPDMNFLKDVIWEFLDDIYAPIGGNKSFENADVMVDESLIWKITYDGPLEDIKNFDINKMYIITAYKSKCGLKAVCSGKRKNPYTKGTEEYNMYNVKSHGAWYKTMITDFKHAWIEVSEEAEKKMMANGAINYVIDPNIIYDNRIKIFGNKGENLKVIDDIHYVRPLGNQGELKQKVALGNIKL
jgi:hypothetical protein